MKKRVFLSTTLMVGALFPLATSAAQTGTIFVLSALRQSLIARMPGEIGKGFGPVYRDSTGDQWMSGTMFDRHGNPALEFEFIQSFGLKPDSVPLDGQEGYLFGRLYTPRDAVGNRQLVGEAEGQWYETADGLGVMRAYLIDPAQPRSPRSVAGIVEGHYRAPLLPDPIGDPGPKVIPGGDKQGKGIQPVPGSGVPPRPLGSPQPGPGAGGFGSGVDRRGAGGPGTGVGDAGSGFGGTGIEETDPTEPDGYVRLRWKIFD